jgi:hypothetical protein
MGLLPPPPPKFQEPPPHHTIPMVLGTSDSRNEAFQIALIASKAASYYQSVATTTYTKVLSLCDSLAD